MAGETVRTSVPAALYNASQEDRIIRAARRANVWLNLVTRKTLPTPGPIAHTFSRFVKIDETSAVGTLTEATAPSLTEITTASAVTITADMVGLDAEISDKVAATGLSDLSPGAQDEMGRAVAAKIDRAIAALASGFSNQVGTTGNNLSLTLINSASYTLDVNEAPLGNEGDESSLGSTPLGLTGKMVVLPPIGTFDLREIMSTSSAAFMSDPAAVDVLFEDGSKPAGFKGSILGIPLFESGHMPSANTGADKLGLMLTPSAIAFVDKWLFRMKMQEDIRKRTTVHAADAFFGVGEFLDIAGVGIVIGAT